MFSYMYTLTQQESYAAGCVANSRNQNRGHRVAKYLADKSVIKNGQLSI